MSTQFATTNVEIKDDLSPTLATSAKQDTQSTKLDTLHTDAAAILAKLSADPATQTTLAAVLAKLSSDPATQTTLAAVLAKLSSDPSTATLQTSTNTKLDTIHTDLGTTLAGYLDGVEGLLGRLPSGGAATEASLAAAAATLTSIAGYVDQLEGYLDGVEGKLDTLHTDIATTLAGYVDGLEGLETTIRDRLAPPVLVDSSTLATAAKQPTLVSGRTPVDGSGVTQPVSGTVTANAGTGPFPVSDNGGSLTVDGTVGVSGTVTTEPTTSKTIKFAKIDTATSGASNTIIAAVTSKKITVLAYSFVVSAAVTVKWVTGVSADLSGAMSFAANGGISKVSPDINVPLLQTASGEALKMTLGGAVQVSGEITYYEA